MNPDTVYDIEQQRQRLAGRIREFHSMALRLFGKVVQTLIGKPDRLNSDGYVSDEVRRTEDRGLPTNFTLVENTILIFPSVINDSKSRLLKDLQSRETRLRRAKANDTLSYLREALSGLSYQYINKVRQSVSTKEHLRAYDGIRALSKEVSFCQQVYNRNSKAIGKLDAVLKLKYPPLRKSECTISAAIANVNGRGQSQARLPWFWSAQNGWDEDNATDDSLLKSDRQLECEYRQQEIALFANQFQHSLSCKLDESKSSEKQMGGRVSANRKRNGMDYIVFHAPARYLVFPPLRTPSTVAPHTWTRGLL